MKNDEARTIGRDQIGDITVSTVFLGLDHNYSGQGGPVLFETMIFGGQYDEQMWRYRTIQEAREGHTFAVSLAMEPSRRKIILQEDDNAQLG